MLGEQIGDLRGQAISTRVLPDVGTGPRIETTNQAIGTLCGIACTSTVTYVGTLRPNGTIAGEGNGVVMGESGEMGTFRGQGVGKILANGSTSWRGTLCFECPTPGLARLNGIAVAFEYEVDEGGKSEGHFYEWK